MLTRPSSIFLPWTLGWVFNLVNSQSTCYWPDGSVAPNYAPCSTDGSVSMCSYTPHADTCEPNGLILGTDGVYFRDACSDPNWSSPGCLPLCPWNSSTYATLTQCEDGSFCCGASNTTCCSSNQGTFVASSIASMISQTTSSPPSSQTSISKSIQPSTTGTAKPVSPSTSPSTQTSTTELIKSSATSPSTTSSTSSSTSQTNTKPTTQYTTNPISPTGTQSSTNFNSSDSSASTASKPSNSNNLAIGLGAGLGVALLFTLGLALGCCAWFFLRKKRIQEEMSELPVDAAQSYGGWNGGNGAVGQKTRDHGTTNFHELHSR